MRKVYEIEHEISIPLFLDLYFLSVCFPWVVDIFLTQRLQLGQWFSRERWEQQKKTQASQANERQISGSFISHVSPSESLYLKRKQSVSILSFFNSRNGGKNTAYAVAVAMKLWFDADLFFVFLSVSFDPTWRCSAFFMIPSIFRWHWVPFLVDVKVSHAFASSTLQLCL